MRDYELTFIIDADLSGEEQKKLLTKVQKTVTELKGKVEKKDEWGRKELSYPIKKKNMGVYFCWEMNLPEKTLGEFDKKLKLEEGVIRYLLVRRPTKSAGK